jgi:preprotein translocase subunit SecY
MISTLFKKIHLILKDKNLTHRIMFVLGSLLVFRFLAAIPIPGVDHGALRQFFNNSQLLGLVNISSGGGLSNFSIVTLGVGPYITASIIMQVATMISPKLKSMYHEEGQIGRKKFTNISRTLTIPLAVLQGFSLLILLQQQGVIAPMAVSLMITNILIITAGSMLLMWIGELITEFGIGNGTSLIIFGGIVAGLPGAIQNIIFTYDPSQLPGLIAFLLVGIAIVSGVVFITEAERPIPITYSRQARGGSAKGVSTYLPLRLNQAGVIPIIFAISILLIPNLIAGVLGGIDSLAIRSISGNITAFMSNQLNYGILYFLFVFLLTFFYTAVTFDPDNTAKNLQKSGAFIPGVRPGEQTAKYIGNVLSRITLVGALFLGSIAVLPIIVQSLTGITTITIGGTALLIAVSVAIDLVKKIDAQVSMREY